MLIKERFEIFFCAQGLAIWARHMFYIYSIIYNSYTAAGNSVLWGLEFFFFCFTTKEASVFRLPQWQVERAQLIHYHRVIHRRTMGLRFIDIRFLGRRHKGDI